MASQAAKAPHSDISMSEVEIATRLCEHLLYLQRRQRSSMRAVMAQHQRLLQLAAVLRSLAAGKAALTHQASNLSAVHTPYRCQSIMYRDQSKYALLESRWRRNAISAAVVCSNVVSHAHAAVNKRMS